jgi:hypothetical protein
MTQAANELQNTGTIRFYLFFLTFFLLLKLVKKKNANSLYQIYLSGLRVTWVIRSRT